MILLSGRQQKSDHMLVAKQFTNGVSTLYLLHMAALLR
jgi:hypothetical protein